MSNGKNIFSILNEENADIHSLFLIEDNKLLAIETKGGKSNSFIYLNSENYIKYLITNRWIIQKISKEQLKNLKTVIKTHEPFVFNSSFIRSGMVYVDVLYNFCKFEIEYDYEFNEYSIIGGVKVSNELMDRLISVSEIEITNKTIYYYCKRCRTTFVSDKFVGNTKFLLCPNKCNNNQLIDRSNKENRDRFLKKSENYQIVNY